MDIKNLYEPKVALTPPYILDYKPSPDKTKIIHVNGNFIIGGTSQLIVDIIERTSDKYSHKVVVPEHPDPAPYQPLSLHRFPFWEMTEMYEFLKNEAPSLVHIHYWVRPEHRLKSFALWYEAVFKICAELKLKVVQNINVPTPPFISTAVVHNVFVSQYVKDHFNNSETTSSVIYPGSNFSHFQNDNIEALPGNSIGMVYRLDTDKLNEQSIEVFIAVVKKNPAVKCYIIGGGHFYEYYNKRVADEGLETNFIFTGVVSYKALPEWYKKISVFVAPVHDESFGQVTPFAMSMGLSVAGYDTGALSEILGSKDTLVEYGNVDSLAAVILGLVKYPEKRLAIGALNRERAHAYFSVGKMIDQYSELYNMYIGSNSNANKKYAEATAENGLSTDE